MPPGGQAHIQHVLRRTALVPHPYGQDVLSRGGRGELPRDPIPPQLSSAPTRVGCPSPCSKDLQQTLHTSVRRGDGQMCTMPMVLKCAFKHVWQPKFCTAHCGAYCFTRTVAVGWHPLKKNAPSSTSVDPRFAGAFVRRCFTRTVALRLASVSKWEHRFSGGHLPYKD